MMDLHGNMLVRLSKQMTWLQGYAERQAARGFCSPPPAVPVEYVSADPKYPGVYVRMVAA